MPSEDADESESECDDEECDSQEGLPLEKASVVCGFDDAVGACTFQQGPWPCESLSPFPFPCLHETSELLALLFDLGWCTMLTSQDCRHERD